MATVMHKILLTAGLLAFGCNGSRSEAFAHANQTFAGYMAAFGKDYVQGSSEYSVREGLFHERLSEILTHNSAGHSWKMGVNEFTDWTEGELRSLRGYKRQQHKGFSMPDVGSSIIEVRQHGDEKPADKPADRPAGRGATEAMDWTSSLATSKDVLNQGPCGSCWAVAATATIQLHAAKVYPKFNKILSPENVNKCAPNPMQCGGTGGCQGSTPELAFDYLKSLGERGGLYAMDYLPYTASTDAMIPEKSCSKAGSLVQLNNFRAPAVTPAVSIADWVQVETNNAQQVMDNLVSKGPLTVAIVGSGIQGYEKGVMSSCKSTVVDHAVVLMGYGKDSTSNMAYWNIRNSWGPHWGEQGFFRLLRHTGNTESGTSGGHDEPCAWDNDPAKGVACKDEHGNYPKKTWVCGVCGIISDVAYPTGVKVHPDLLS